MFTRRIESASTLPTMIFFPRASCLDLLFLLRNSYNFGKFGPYCECRGARSSIAIFALLSPGYGILRTSGSKSRFPEIAMR